MSDKEEQYIMGIDEAGRGPVLSAMVYGACMCKVSRLEDLKNSGYADSKVLSETQRAELFIGIKSASDYLHWLVDVIPPDWLSSKMLEKDRFSLNEVSHDSAMGLIQRALDAGYNLSEVYVDTVGIPEHYETKLNSHFMGYNIRFTVAKKADSTYPIVSAASICAKVTRDRVIEHWRFIEPFLKDFNAQSNHSASSEAKTPDADDVDTTMSDTSAENTPESDPSQQNDTADTVDNDAAIEEKNSGDTASADDKGNDAVDDNGNDDSDAAETTEKSSPKEKTKKKKYAGGHPILGNGYPGDDRTKLWLQNNLDSVFAFPAIVRYGWSTAKIIIEDRCAKVEWSDEIANNSLARWGFGAVTKQAKRAPFYKQRNLQVCCGEDPPF